MEQRSFPYQDKNPLTGAATCVMCGVELSLHNAAREKTCDQLQCRGRYLQMTADPESLQGHRLQLRVQQSCEDRNARDLVAEVVCRQFTDEESLPVLVVPTNRRACGETTPQAKKTFLANLRAAIQKSAELTEARADVDRQEPRADTTTIEQCSAVTSCIGQACSTCKGWCCSQGEGHAFLTAEQISIKRKQRPEWSDEDIVREYAARIPSDSYAEGCLFQGEQGCVLPFEMRADICNVFVCEGISDHLESAGSETGEYLIASARDQDLDEVVSIEGDNRACLFVDRPTSIGCPDEKPKPT